MLRQEGFYWLKFKYDSSSTIGRWDAYDSEDGSWSIVGSDEIFYDNEFEEIGPRIIRNEVT